MCLFREWVVKVMRDLRRKKHVKDHIFEKMMYGEPMFGDPIKDPLVRETLDKLNEKLHETGNHLERMKLLEDSYPEENLMAFMNELVQGMEKNDEDALGLKQKAQVYFNKSKHEHAIRLCNLGLMLAPTASIVLQGSLFSDRAIYLHGKREWEPAIHDIDTAFDYLDNIAGQIPLSLENKLLLMQRRCIRVKNSAPMRAIRAQFTRQIHYRKDVIFKLHTEPHPKIPAAAKSIALMNHAVKGRILIFEEDLKVGTTVIVEAPYMTVLTDVLQRQSRHCAKCHEETNTMIPCTGCTYVCYCSEKCRQDDYDRGHKYECKCMDHFHAINLPTNAHLAFKAVLKAGPNYMYNLFRENKKSGGKEPKKANKGIRGYNPETGIYESDSYYQIHNLISHFQGKDLDVHVWYSHALLKLLSLRTNYFAKIDPADREDFQLFLGSIFLHHTVSVPFNVMSLWERDRLKKSKKLRIFGRNRVAPAPYLGENPGLNGLYAFSSLLGHSCDPSTLRVNLADGTLAIMTARDVQKGEEVTISYGYEFSTHKYSTRHPELNESYFFSCECIACTGKWPLVKELSYTEYKHLCPTCSPKFSYTENCQTSTCVLTRKSDEKMECQNCQKEFKTRLLVEEVRNYRDKLRLARPIVFGNQPMLAIPILLECSHFFQYHVRSPSKHLIQTQALYLLALDNISLANK